MLRNKSLKPKRKCYDLKFVLIGPSNRVNRSMSRSFFLEYLVLFIDDEVTTPGYCSPRSTTFLCKSASHFDLPPKSHSLTNVMLNRGHIISLYSKILKNI